MDREKIIRKVLAKLLQKVPSPVVAEVERALRRVLQVIDSEDTQRPLKFFRFLDYVIKREDLDDERIHELVYRLHEKGLLKKSKEANENLGKGWADLLRKHNMSGLISRFKL